MTNTANSGGEYSQGFDVKEAGKKLKIKVTFLLWKEAENQGDISFMKTKSRTAHQYF